MFRPRIGQQVLMAIALGLFLLPTVSRADTIPKPKDSASTINSLSVVQEVKINAQGNPATSPTYTQDAAANAPNNNFFGTFDLTNNDLIIHPAAQNAASAQATYRAVSDMIRQAADEGAFDGTGGITSSFAAQNVTSAQNAQLLGVGVLLNDDGTGQTFWGDANSVFGPFDGNSNISQFDTIVKYTWYGDLFLEGHVASGEVTAQFKNLGKTFTGADAANQTWLNGDFFYDNTSGIPIGTGTQLQAFKALQHQNDNPFPFASAGPGALSVPEPSAIVLGLMGLFGLFLGAKKASLRKA